MRTLPVHSRQWLIRFTALLLCLAGTAPVCANPKIYRQTLRATGWVIVPKDEHRSQMGTCWVVDRERGLVVTCQHVVGDAREVLVYFPCSVKGEVAAEAGYYLKNVRVLTGRVEAADSVRDLALIRLPSLPRDVEALPLAAKSARPGEAVHSVGNSGVNGNLEDGTLWWYTSGTVRQSYRRRIDRPEGVRHVRLLETQSPVNQGDSGGPVVNDRGEVVGVACDYRADGRLVSENVDIQEVREFLRLSMPADGAATAVTVVGDTLVPSAGSLVGSWRFATDAASGKDIGGRAEFTKHGTFVLTPQREGRKVQRGRYAYANGVLWLISERGPATVRVTWTGQDRFSVRSKGPELVFDRHQEKETIQEVEADDP